MSTTSVQNVNVSQRAAAALEQTANQLNAATKDALADAKAIVNDAGHHIKEAGGHAAGGTVR